MTTRAAALAFAAPLLLTAPALADKGHGKRSGASVSIHTGNGSLHFKTGGHHGYSGYKHGYDHRYGLNRFGQTAREEKQLRRQAIRACRRAIHHKASYIGFRDVDFDDGARARQIAPAGFQITFREVEFEGRRRDFERRVSCTVRRGNSVRYIEGIPQPGRRGHKRDRYPYS